MNKLAIGTYSFGFGMDLASKLRTAASYGYTGIEFLEQDLKGADVGALKALLAETGLEATSAHCMPDGMREVAPVLAALGGKLLIAPMLQFADRDETVRTAKMLEEKGREVRQHGVVVGYHNHTEEFNVDAGLTLEEHLLANTDPSLVTFQLDCGWAAAAGVDCPAFLRKHAGRFRSIHVKENDRFTGPQPALRMDAPRGGFKVERDADGKPIMTEELKAMLAAMRERTKIQCRMGAAESRIDWKAVQAACAVQGHDVLWVVERENDYLGTGMLDCLREDAEWLKANL